MAGLSWDNDNLATRDDLAVLRGELRGEMAELRGDLRAEMGELRGDVRMAVADGVRTMVLATVASNATIAAVVVAALQLG